MVCAGRLRMKAGVPSNALTEKLANKLISLSFASSVVTEHLLLWPAAVLEIYRVGASSTPYSSPHLTGEPDSSKDYQIVSGLGKRPLCHKLDPDHTSCYSRLA